MTDSTTPRTVSVTADAAASTGTTAFREPGDRRFDTALDVMGHGKLAPGTPGRGAAGFVLRLDPVAELDAAGEGGCVVTRRPPAVVAPAAAPAGSVSVGSVVVPAPEETAHPEAALQTNTTAVLHAGVAGGCGGGAGAGVLPESVTAQLPGGV